ncbi:MAG: hypothetical protein ACLFS1_06035 [Opitutales bacterium]
MFNLKIGEAAIEHSGTATMTFFRPCTRSLSSTRNIKAGFPPRDTRFNKPGRNAWVQWQFDF